VRRFEEAVKRAAEADKALREARREMREALVEGRREGATLQQLGDLMRMTRQRVRAILSEQAEEKAEAGPALTSTRPAPAYLHLPAGGEPAEALSTPLSLRETGGGWSPFLAGHAETTTCNY